MSTYPPKTNDQRWANEDRQIGCVVSRVGFRLHCRRGSYRLHVSTSVCFGSVTIVVVLTMIVFVIVIVVAFVVFRVSGVFRTQIFVFSTSTLTIVLSLDSDTSKRADLALEKKC